MHFFIWTIFHVSGHHSSENNKNLLDIHNIFLDMNKLHQRQNKAVAWMITKNYTMDGEDICQKLIFGVCSI